MSTALGTATVAFSVYSWAPLPATTCVSVSDSRTGATASATYVQTYGDGSSLWTYALVLPQSAQEGYFGLSAVAKDCTNGTVLTGTAYSSYTVDNTAPVIDPTSIVPFDQGNTAFTAEPLIAGISDALTGVDQQSIAFTLTDTTASPETTTTYSAGYGGGR